jgi:hypothetical protein
MLESELGNRTTGALLNARDIQPRRSYAGILCLMLLAFCATLAWLAHQNGAFNAWLGSEGASVRKTQPWIKANDYKIIYVPVPASGADKDRPIFEDDILSEDAVSPEASQPPIAAGAAKPATATTP